MQQLVPACPEAPRARRADPGSQEQPQDGRNHWETLRTFRTRPQTSSLYVHTGQVRVCTVHVEVCVQTHTDTVRKSWPTPTKLSRVSLRLLQQHDLFPHDAAVLFAWTFTEIHRSGNERCYSETPQPVCGVCDSPDSSPSMRCSLMMSPLWKLSWFLLSVTQFLTATTYSESWQMSY